MINTLLNYQLQVGICLVLFYIFYKVFLSKETFYKLNRFLLLSLVGLSFALPLLPWGDLWAVYGLSTPALPSSVFKVELAELSVGAGAESLFSGWGILLLVYLVGAGLVWIGVCVEFIKLHQLMKASRLLQKTNGIKVLSLPKLAHVPFSWMSSIFISEEDLAACGEEILLHEKAHVYYKHSWDVLLLNLVLVVQWFNPAAWLLKRELEMVHEYQADAYVLRKGIDAQQYQLLLIKKSVGSYMFHLANSFNHSHLTKRITMMLKKKSSQWASLKLMYILPLVGMIAFVLGCSQTGESLGSTDRDAESALANIQADVHEKPDGQEVLNVAEEMPEFPGGMQELMKYLGASIKYPLEAQKEGLTGRVVVQFVVGKDGAVSNPEVVRGVAPALDDEAIRVVQSMPKWTPGKHKGELVSVKYTLPISFRLK